MLKKKKPHCCLVNQEIPTIDPDEDEAWMEEFLKDGI